MSFHHAPKRFLWGFASASHQRPCLHAVQSHRCILQAPSRLKDAVPVRYSWPRKEDPLDVMIPSLCPKVGDGVVRMKWRTKVGQNKVTKEWIVKRGLPGEVVTMRFGIVKDKGWPIGDFILYADPTVTKLRKSRFEVRPACPHFDTCGGCDFLSLQYGRQLVEKQRWVQSALLGAKIPLKVLSTIRPSEPQLRYANRTEWIFRETDGELYVGPPGTPPSQPEPGEAPSSCVLPQRAVIRTMSQMFSAFQEARLARPATYSIYDEVRGFGTFKGMVVLCTKAPPAEPNQRPGRGNRRTELLLNIVLACEVEEPRDVLGPLVDMLVEHAPSCLVGVVANVARSKREIMGGRRELLLHGRRFLQQEFVVRQPFGPDGHHGQPYRFRLEIGSNARLPAHTGILPEVASTVLEMCDIGHTDVVWHCFCGGGELSLAIGAACEHVVAIGTSAAEVSELKRNLAINKVSNTTAVLTNLRSPWTLKQLSFHITQSQQKRLLLGTGDEQEKAREYALTAFVPGESRRRQMQRLSAAPFNAPLLRSDALAVRELRVLLPAFVRDFRPVKTTLPVLVGAASDAGEKVGREVPPEMESRLKRLYRRLAFKYHPDQNPGDPEAPQRFQALTRAYKALVGDSAGPEEGDEDAKDPFLLVKQSSYRPKFKHRWREEETPKIKKKAKESATKDAEDQEQEDVGIDERIDLDDEDEEEDPDFVVKMEIDDTFAGGLTEVDAGTMPEERHLHDAPKESRVREVVLREGSAEMTINEDASPMPTLPPPDVILVTQPRARKQGRGTPSHFRNWLRSTAARAIVYVARDAGAFESDVTALMGLGYGVVRVQPFDPEPHRRSVLLVARLELIRPLVGSEDRNYDRGQLLTSPGLIAGDQSVPLLGSGGYVQLPK